MLISLFNRVCTSKAISVRELWNQLIPLMLHCQGLSFKVFPYYFSEKSQVSFIVVRLWTRECKQKKNTIIFPFLSSSFLFHFAPNEIINLKANNLRRRPCGQREKGAKKSSEKLFFFVLVFVQYKNTWPFLLLRQDYDALKDERKRS